ncbi:MAG: YcgN family cysteine cluster protein [Rhodospirillaceae bacterium]|nr:MAG: YcgN family cysteine cluster protein [Rhodospirillaceae bacterium]
MTERRKKAGFTPFWRTKTLTQMSNAEWESLCDGCGKCCLHKIREDDGTLTLTNVACRLLDTVTGRCGNYRRRKTLVPDCVVLTPKMARDLDWLPSTCAYRLVGAGKDLPSWHPLKTGDPASVLQAGISVTGRCVSERTAGPLRHHVVEWPEF